MMLQMKITLHYPDTMNWFPPIFARLKSASWAGWPIWAHILWVQFQKFASWANWPIWEHVWWVQHYWGCFLGSWFYFSSSTFLWTILLAFEELFSNSRVHSAEDSILLDNDCLQFALGRNAALVLIFILVCGEDVHTLCFRHSALFSKTLFATVSALWVYVELRRMNTLFLILELDADRLVLLRLVFA